MEALRHRTGPRRGARRHLSRPRRRQIAIRHRRGAGRDPRHHAAHARACRAFRRELDRAAHALFRVARQGRRRGRTGRGAQPPHARSRARRDDRPAPMRARQWSWCGSTSTSPMPSSKRSSRAAGDATPAVQARPAEATCPRPGPAPLTIIFGSSSSPRKAPPRRPSFTMVKQDFGGAYADLPANDWGKPNGMTTGERLQAQSAR